MPSLANDLAEKNANFGVKRAYGEPVEMDGVTFTPVALTMSGFGGGQAEGEGGGEGGGGGGIVIPLGVYVQREEGLRFEPNAVTFLAVAIPFVCVAGRAIARIIRALKR